MSTSKDILAMLEAVIGGLSVAFTVTFGLSEDAPEQIVLPEKVWLVPVIVIDGKT